MTPDIINAIFEFTGGIFLCLNIHRMYKDKQLKGAHWAPVCFFTGWGLWNLIFYPYLHLWWSFVGGLWLCTINCIWLGMTFYYKLRESHVN